MSEIETFQMYIGGDWCEPASGEYFESYNPFTGQVWARMPRGGEADAERAVAAARTAFTSGPWPQLNPTQRGQAAQRPRLAEALDQHLFFAGEATSSEFYSTAHGAHLTGIKTAREVARSLGKRD